MDLKNLPQEKEMRKSLKETIPRLKPRARKLLLTTLKGLYKTKRITKEKYEEAMKEFEAYDKK
jgi:hypothetical protein